MPKVYTIEVLRSGQPRPYADTENEYLVTITASRWGKEGLHPWFRHGDTIVQRTWARGIVRALCQNFREPGDDDGRTGMEAHFYPTLKRLDINPDAGTIRALIIEPFTD